MPRKNFQDTLQGDNTEAPWHKSHKVHNFPRTERLSKLDKLQNVLILHIASFFEGYLDTLIVKCSCRGLSEVTPIPLCMKGFPVKIAGDKDSAKWHKRLCNNEYAICGLNLILMPVDTSPHPPSPHPLEIILKNPGKWSTLDDLLRCSKHSHLAIHFCNALTIVAGLERYNLLRQLSIHNCDGLTSLDGMEKCHSLQELDIIMCHGLTSTHGLKECHSLDKLGIHW